jgi:hypothetical protein
MKFKTKKIDKKNEFENQTKSKPNQNFGFLRKKKLKDHRVKKFDLILNILVEKEKFIFPKNFYS